MAQPPPERKPGNLRLRILSALIFAPPVFAVIHVGSPWFDAMVVIAGLLMSWEWARMCCDGEYAMSGWVLTVGIAGAAAATMAGTPLLGIAVVAIVAIILVPVGRMGGRYGGIPCFWRRFDRRLYGVVFVDLVIFLILGKNLRFGWFSRSGLRIRADIFLVGQWAASSWRRG